MRRSRRVSVRFPAAVLTVLAWAATTAAQESPYDRLLVMDAGGEPGTQAVLAVDVEAENPVPQRLAQGQFDSGIPCVAAGTAFLIGEGGLRFVDVTSGEIRHAKLPDYPLGGEVGGGRVFLLTSSWLQVIDIASRSSRELALPDLPPWEPGARLQPSPSGRRVALYVQQREQMGDSDMWSAKPEYDLVVCDADTGKTYTAAVVTWSDSPTTSVLGRGPRIAWLDDTTLVTLHKPAHEAAAILIRVNIETGAVDEGPGLPGEAALAAEPRLSVLPGVDPPRLEVRGGFQTFVLDPYRWTSPREALARHFEVTHEAGASEVRYAGKVIDRESGPECIRDLAVSPDGKRAAWTAALHTEGKEELRYYDVEAQKVRALGTLGPGHSRFVWISAAELTRPTPPPKPPKGWEPLNLE